MTGGGEGDPLVTVQMAALQINSKCTENNLSKRMKHIESSRI